MPVFFVVASLFVLFFLDLFTPKAYAYLDPGMGSSIFQIMIAVIVGGLFALKLFRAKIVLFFTKLFSRRKNNG